MHTMKILRIPIAISGAAILLLSAEGCAHRRQTYYPNDLATPNPGVHVRAPFVDVQVRGKPKTEREERAARRDNDRDDDDDERD